VSNGCCGVVLGLPLQCYNNRPEVRRTNFILFSYPSSAMVAHSRSPGIPNTASPSLRSAARDNYNTSTPHLMRHPLSSRCQGELMPRTPPASHPAASRVVEPLLSPSAASTTANLLPMNPTSHFLDARANGPPLEQTQAVPNIQVKSSDGRVVQPEIMARIDKGFFLADQDWTCYRRNYFSVVCSYTFKQTVPPGPLTLTRNGLTESVNCFAMHITAVVDGAGGKPIDLVQHTPKRDKGPVSAPKHIKLSPTTPPSLSLSTGGTSSSNMFNGSRNSSSCGGTSSKDSSAAKPSPDDKKQANFDRMQFKSATANNGKRRAAQQYYHLVIELHADISSQPSSEPRWIKIATRMSAPMVVRGRSPGHYCNERRTSSSSMGPSGDRNGDGPSVASSIQSGWRVIGRLGAPARTLGGASSSAGCGSSGMSSHAQSPDGSSGRSGESSGASSVDGLAGEVDHPGPPILSAEEASNIDEFHGYQYFPSTIYEASVAAATREEGQAGFAVPCRVSEMDGLGRQSHDTAKVHRTFAKGEFTAGPLPSMSLGTPWRGGPIRDAKQNVEVHSKDSGQERERGAGKRDKPSKSCGRFEGIKTSKGYYPDLPAV
jgi:meiosis-specific transcription factor NDT80